MYSKLKKTSNKQLLNQIEELPSSDFTKACYHIIARIPRGKVVTYQSIAEHLGSKAYRAVGTAMAKNPLAPTVPCHRVVNSTGRIGQYAFGQIEKIRLLESEGIEIKAGKVIDLEKYIYKF